MFVCGAVFLPVRALLYVRDREFPLLAAILEAREQPLSLLFLREVQEELHDARAVSAEIALVRIDVVVTMVPELILRCAAFWKRIAEQLAMHARHENVFIVGTVEDPDAASFGHGFDASPEIVVAKLFRRWLPEACDLDALRIHAGHDVRDGSVFACTVHSLEDDEQRATAGSGEHRLELAEATDISLQFLLGRCFVAIATGRTRIDGLKVDRPPRFHEESAPKLHPLPFSRVRRPPSSARESLCEPHIVRHG